VSLLPRREETRRDDETSSYSSSAEAVISMENLRTPSSVSEKKSEKEEKREKKQNKKKGKNEEKEADIYEKEWRSLDEFMDKKTQAPSEEVPSSSSLLKALQHKPATPQYELVEAVVEPPPPPPSNSGSRRSPHRERRRDHRHHD